MKDALYFCKIDNPHHACLKMYNEKGQELSVAGDDSRGAMPNLGRVDAVTYETDGRLTDHGPVLNAGTLLRLLAAHMGYRLVKKS